MASEEFRNIQTKWVEKVLRSDKYCDAIFIVGQQRKQMFGFRGLLANISPVFEAQFYGSFRESSCSEPVEYPTISPNVFECIIRSSMNLDPNINAENVMELIQVSQMLQIPQLQKECAGFLEHNLNVDNVLYVLNAGYCLNSLNQKFYKKSHRIALKNAPAMLKNSGFYSLHPDLLISFLRSNCFKVKEELLWNATFKWAQNIVNKGLRFKHKHKNNTQLFEYHSYNHNYNIWQKSLKQSISKHSKASKITSDSSSFTNEDETDEEQDIELLEDEDDLSDDDDFGESDLHRNAMNDAFTDDTDHKEEDEKEAVLKCREDPDALHIDAYDKKIYDALLPVIPYLRYALMDKQFFIDNVSKYLSPKQRDAVYVHYILPNRATNLFTDSERIAYSNKAFNVVESNVRADKAKMLNLVDDWWSHTNFASMSPQWFVVKLPDPSYIVTIHWKNRWGDGETAKDIDLQVSNEPNAYNKHDSKWRTFWTFRSEKTSNWLAFQVPQNHDIKPSMYWRFVVKTLYGDNSCRCGLDQIKITNAL